MIHSSPKAAQQSTGLDEEKLEHKLAVIERRQWPNCAHPSPYLNSIDCLQEVNHFPVRPSQPVEAGRDVVFRSAEERPFAPEKMMRRLTVGLSAMTLAKLDHVPPYCQSPPAYELRLKTLAPAAARHGRACPAGSATNHRLPPCREPNPPNETRQNNSAYGCGATAVGHQGRHFSKPIGTFWRQSISRRSKLGPCGDS